MKIVIVGGGFAGIQLAKKLAKNKAFTIVVVDKNNYHTFAPLLYQVSTAFIEASNIAFPLRRLFQNHPNVRFHYGKLIEIIPAENKIHTSSGTLAYDHLVLAMGTQTNFFGLENVERYALPMKSINDALYLRNQILLNFEKAARSAVIEEKEMYSTIVIAGGGPTGVELAGMLAEMNKKIVPKDYPELSNIQPKIYLIDGMPTLLGTMSKKAQTVAYTKLKALGVEIKLNCFVRDYSYNQVLLSNEEKISTANLVWASGVITPVIKGLSAAKIERGGRLCVNEINLLAPYTNIFSIGDMCLMNTDKAYPKGHPQLAQVAIQQGNLLAKNLVALSKNKPTQAFSYYNKGSMAIIAKYNAVVDLPRYSFAGFFAWITWLFIHIVPLIGFSNQLKVFTNWFQSFITNNPTLRLIIKPNQEKK